MNEATKELLLNGMPAGTFVAWYAVAMAGALVYLLSRVYKAIKTDGSTPQKFSWKHTTKGLIKFAAAMILIPWTIIYFSDVAPIMMEFLFKPGGKEMSIELNGFSAFMIGLGIDALIHKAFKLKNTIKK